jgi:hypothetical protein
MRNDGSLDLPRGVPALFYPSTSKVSAHVVWTLGPNYKRKLETLARICFSITDKNLRSCRHYTSAKYALVSGHYFLESVFFYAWTFRGFVNNGRSTSSELCAVVYDSDTECLSARTERLV